MTPQNSLKKTQADINSTDVFLGQSPKAVEIKVKIKKWDLTRLRSFCTTKETINKMKRRSLHWDKMLANDMIDKGLISKIQKQLIQFNNLKNPIEK